jgi:hypothetical protein
MRRSPRVAVVAVTVALLGLLGAFGAPGYLSPERTDAATLNATAADTGDGVLMLVRGTGFAPGRDVRLFWHHPTDSTVYAQASESGEVIAAVPMPDAHHAALDGDASTIDLIADDGVTTARTEFAVYNSGLPETASLGGALASRVEVNGEPRFLLGANYPWMNYGNDFGSNGWGSYGVRTSAQYDADFAAMAADGAHVVRWWLFADGRAGIDFAPDGTPLRVQPEAYADLDRALEIAREHNIYLQLVLFDVGVLANPFYYGGVKMGGHTDMFTDPVKRAELVNNVVRPLAQRYADDPMILSWELMHRPEEAIHDLPTQQPNPAYAPVSMAQFWSFASAASQMIHLYAQDNVTVGSASLKWHRVWTDAFAAARGLPQLHLDYYTTRFEPWMTCCETDDAELGTTSWSPLGQPAWSLGLDRPIIVGRIDMPAGAVVGVLDALLANGYGGALGWSARPQDTADGTAMDWDALAAWDAQHSSLTAIDPPPADGGKPAGGGGAGGGGGGGGSAAATSTSTATHESGGAAPPPTRTPTAVSSVPEDEGVTPIATNTRTSTATSTQTSTAAATQTPTVTAVATNTRTSTATHTSTNTYTATTAATQTPTSTRTPTPVPPAPTATPTIGGGCVSNCGTPRYFCDTWTGGGFCDDYRQKGSGATHVPFPAAGDPYSFDALSSTYTTYVTEGPAPADGLRAFSSNEHFMTVIEDGQFGMGVLRLQQPFDFAGREGHVHFDIDLKTSARRYVRFMLSPDLTKVLTDDRQADQVRPADAFDLWFVNGTFLGRVYRGGSEQGGFNIWNPRYYGQDNVRDSVDVYVTRNHVRILVNGEQFVSESVPDMGFDRAYVYLLQVSYNPCKDGECSENLQMFHWDNVAFDGPVLARNSLTASGRRDVVFNAYSADSCSVNGVAAAPAGLATWGHWMTWVANLPDDGTSVGVGNISCDYSFSQDGSQVPRGLEIVKR